MDPTRRGPGLPFTTEEILRARASLRPAREYRADPVGRTRRSGVPLHTEPLPSQRRVRATLGAAAPIAESTSDNARRASSSALSTPVTGGNGDTRGRITPFRNRMSIAFNDPPPDYQEVTANPSRYQNVPLNEAATSSRYQNQQQLQEEETPPIPPRSSGVASRGANSGETSLWSVDPVGLLPPPAPRRQANQWPFSDNPRDNFPPTREERERGRQPPSHLSWLGLGRISPRQRQRSPDPTTAPPPRIVSQPAQPSQIQPPPRPPPMPQPAQGTQAQPPTRPSPLPRSAFSLWQNNGMTPRMPRRTTSPPQSQRAPPLPRRSSQLQSSSQGEETFHAQPARQRTPSPPPRRPQPTYDSMNMPYQQNRPQPVGRGRSPPTSNRDYGLRGQQQPAPQSRQPLNMQDAYYHNPLERRASSPSQGWMRYDNIPARDYSQDNAQLDPYRQQHHQPDMPPPRPPPRHRHGHSTQSPFQPYDAPPPRPPRQEHHSYLDPSLHFQSYHAGMNVPPPPPPRLSYMGSGTSGGQFGDSLTRIMEHQSQQTRVLIARQNTANKLPTFSGNPLEWQLFNSQYVQQSIACNFTPEENTSRLDQAIRGEARELVRGLLFVRNNPAAIMERLRERYGRPEYIIRALTEVARKIPTSKENNMNNILDYSAAVNNLVTTIETLNVPAHLQNPQLLMELVDKLPNSLRMQWGAFIMMKSYYDLRDLAAWIRSVASAVSLVTPPTFSTEESTTAKKGSRKKPESTFVAAEAISTFESTPVTVTVPVPKPRQQSQQQKSQPKTDKQQNPECPACKKRTKHKLYHCEDFKKMEVKARWEVVKKAKVCFKCLNAGHFLNDCESRDCTVDNCGGRHNNLLHAAPEPARRRNNAQQGRTENRRDSQQRNHSNSETEETNGNINQDGSTSVLLRVLPVKIYGPNKTIIFDALMDDASTVTIIDDSVSTDLELTGPLDPLRLRWTDGSTQHDNSSRRVSLMIGPVIEKGKFTMRNVRTVHNLNLPKQKMNHAELIKKYPYLNGVPLHKFKSEAPRMIIGQPHIHLTLARAIREGGEDDPVATQTKLGWIIHGNIPGGPDENHVNYAFSCIHESDDEFMHRIMKEQFALESTGIVNVPSNRSREDIEAEKLMDSITRRIEDGRRFETGLLWRKSTGFMKNVQQLQAPVQEVPIKAARVDGRVPVCRSAGNGQESYPFQLATTEGNSIPCRVPSLPLPLVVARPLSVGGINTNPDSFRLPSSRETAFRRLEILERKLKKNPELRQQFQEKIEHYIQNGYARRLSPEETKIQSDREWFLPLFGTFHPNKPGKLRLIWDAASKSRGKCLNDFLYTGPDLLASLPGILLKFRRGAVAFSGDITEMFHQVRIRKEDCPAQRFLWRDNPESEPSVFQLEVMMFGSVCSPYCAQYVKNRNAKDHVKSYPEAASAIINRHYMDDYLESCNRVKEAIVLYEDVTRVHSKGGFHIGKWISNSPELLQCIPEDDRATSVKDLTEWSEVPTERALGLHWNPRTDMFTFKVNLERAGKGIATGEEVPTKRAILRLIMLVWDPLGFLAHFMVTARLIIQHLWRLKVGWDDQIPEEVFLKWKKWIRQLPLISEIQIPRHYSPRVADSDNIQLHIFADASEVAFSSVAYLRIEYEGGVDVAFVLSKARVAPLKPTSIPRLELQAAHIAARMAKFILTEQDLPISNTYYWSDSCTVLKWIRSEARRFQQFVANRVGEIQELTDVSQWRWVPTKQNPADDATREGTADLSSSSRWWNGPAFLKEEEEDWPTEPICNERENEENELEVRKDFLAVQVEVPVFDHLPDINRFSNYNRFVRATAYVRLPFLVKIWKLNEDQLPPELPIAEAERDLIIRSQWESYGDEMTLLSRGEDIPKSSKLYPLSPVLDEEGIMRFKSRLATASDEYLRLPVILHPKSRLVKLIIIHYHQRSHHHSATFVHNEIRQKYWINSAKTTIRNIVRACGYCRIKKARLPKPPMMGDMPDFRIQQQQRPFMITGMDYFGPYEVTVKRSHEKRYGVIFTCLTTRAIHLEIAYDLTTDSCLMAIRRFIARRGYPAEIHSDNGTNLRGAERELRQSLDDLNQKKMKDELQIRRIKWRFVPPRSPHFAGVWERMVRSVKNALSTILKCRFPKDEVLITVFHEAESLVNSRPLTDVPVDGDSPEALTPFHFLIGTSSPHQIPGEFQESEANLGRKWKQTQALINMFWVRWVKGYLPTLQLRQKWRDMVPNVEVGDVVVLFDVSLSRGSYPLGLVVDTIAGKDGVVRVVIVKVGRKFYRRPVVKVARVGVRSESTGELGSNPSVDYRIGGEAMFEGS